jgi:hypothetical protein
MDNRPWKGGPIMANFGGWLGDVEGPVIASAVNPDHWTSDTRDYFRPRKGYSALFRLLRKVRERGFLSDN